MPQDVSGTDECGGKEKMPKVLRGSCPPVPGGMVKNHITVTGLPVERYRIIRRYGIV